MPTFSYAQAAKGASETPAPAKSVSTPPEKVDSKPVEQTSDVPESTPVAPETETSQEVEKTAPAAVEQDSEFTTVTSKTRSKATQSRTSSPSVRSTTTQAKEGDSSNTAANGSQEASSEKQKAQADAKADKADKSENGTDETKEKSGKSEKAEKNVPPKELKAAPLPSVNIWQQRKEAQEAKAKVSPAPTSGKPASGKVTEEAQQQDSSKVNPKKKSADGAQEGGKGSKKSDGGKGRDGVVPPPVEDASSWPTPEVAIGEDKKKAQEKTDKTEKSDKSPVMRPHGKDKWMPVSYVPTAVFNTPLPTAGNRGGRKPARGGRGAGGSSHAANTPAGDKATQGQAKDNNSGAAGKQASGDRGRNDANRAASLPAQPRRSTSSDVNNADGRNKAQATERNSNNNSRGPRAEETKSTNGGDANNNVRPPRDGKQFNRGNDARNGKAGHLSVDPQAAVRANDRRVESGSKSADFNREANNAGFQEFNRERGDQRGGRPNRGRGGAYNGFGNQNAQFGNVGNHFTPKNLGFNDRQRAQHGIANGSQQGNRMPMRSPSLPASAAPGVYPYPPFPAEINTVYSYQAMGAGPMSAMPYPQYMEPYGLMPMLTMQLEYYFSVDNMCKDMFLRRQMDSEGFVPLSVIANFKRIKSLTEDFELIRLVGRQLQNVEYRTGEDGVDRVRPRERWDQWVLPYDQRDAAARHEGAAHAQPTKTEENTPLSNHSNHNDVSSNGSIHPASRQFIHNGTPSNNAPKGLSSTAPEFMPSALNEVANVGPPVNIFCEAVNVFCDTACETEYVYCDPSLANVYPCSYGSNPDPLEEPPVDSFQPALRLDFHDSPPVFSPWMNESDPVRYVCLILIYFNLLDTAC